MQATSRGLRNLISVRQRAYQPQTYQPSPLTPEIKEALHNVFTARQELARKLSTQILTEGQPEVWNDSTALCTHYRTRRGVVSGEMCDAQVHTHETGVVIRFWVYGKNFETRTRDLILLRLPRGEKGYEVWLDDGEKVFPHEAGKYAQAGQVILANIAAGM